MPLMWLLDANMLVQLVALLATLGVDADSAVTRGWNRLSKWRSARSGGSGQLRRAFNPRKALWRIGGGSAPQISGVLCCASHAAAGPSRDITYADRADTQQQYS